MTPSSQPSSGATQGYVSYGPPGQGYNFPQGGYGAPQMFPPQRFTGQGLSSPGAPRVPPALPGNIPVIWPTSSASTPYGQLPGPPGRPPISLPTKRFQPAAEPRRTDVAGIADLPPLPEISYDEFDADYENDDSSDLGGSKGKAPISLKETEFSLKQFAKGWGSPTLVHSTSGRKYGWLGFLRTSTGPLSWDRTIQNRSVMDPCTGRWRLQIFWTLSRSGCPWKTSIMPNGFGDNGLRCFLTNVQARFGRRGRREGEATSDQQRIWESARAKKREVTSQSCQIQLSWL